MTDSSNTIVVTRHPALVQYAREIGLVDATTPVVAHVVSPEDIRGKHVVGVLPLHLASLAARVTEIPLQLDSADRGVELDIARIREIAEAPRSYVVLDAQAFDAGIEQESCIFEDVGAPYVRPSEVMRGRG